MTPLKALKKAVQTLEELDCEYCLIGGHAASLYRTQERLTKDVDFAVAAKDIKQSKKCATKCIESLGLKPVMGFIPHGIKEEKRKSVCMITSEAPPNQFTGIIDIILPELPWVLPAIKRAQYNQIDLGFAAVPVITPEDLIIAKCYALKNNPDRFQDLDDLKEIFNSSESLDLDYLREGLKEFSLTIPKAVKKYAVL